MQSWIWKCFLLLFATSCFTGCSDSGSDNDWRHVTLYRDASESDTEWDESFARRAQFSFAMRQRIDRGGDTSLIVRYSQVLQDYEFKLTAADRVDLGALLTPPKHIPASTAFDASGIPMQVGHYYFMRTGDVYVLLQVTRFVYQMNDRLVTFRYLASQDGLDGLNALMAGSVQRGAGGKKEEGPVDRFRKMTWLLLLLGAFTVLYGWFRFKLGGEDAQAQGRNFLLIGFSILSITILGHVVIGLSVATSAIGSFVASSPYLVPVGICIIGIVCASAYGWNILYRKLNAVKRTRRAVDVLLAKAECTPEALLKVAREAGDHERRFHTDIAKAHSRQSLFVIGGVSFRQNPPDVTATPLFGTAQTEIRQDEDELVLAWANWAEAAEVYENARNSFPLVLVALLCRFPTIDFHDD